MDRVWQNGGTFGLISAVVLAVLFILVLTSGFTPSVAADPSQALQFIKASGGRWFLSGVLGVLGSLLAVVFTAGLYRVLRDKAPTRAYAVLLFGVLGSGGYALSSLAQWVGGTQVAGTADTVEAGHAWVAVNAMVSTFGGFGNAFIGAALLAAGWAITSTRALTNGIGWLAYAAGVVTVLGLFTSSLVVFLGSFALIITWLAWTGWEMRR